MGKGGPFIICESNIYHLLFKIMFLHIFTIFRKKCPLNPGFVYCIGSRKPENWPYQGGVWCEWYGIIFYGISLSFLAGIACLSLIPPPPPPPVFVQILAKVGGGGLSVIATVSVSKTWTTFLEVRCLGVELWGSTIIKLPLIREFSNIWFRTGPFFCGLRIFFFFNPKIFYFC